MTLRFDKSKYRSGFFKLVLLQDVSILLSRSKAGGVSLQEIGWQG